MKTLKNQYRTSATFLGLSAMLVFSVLAPQSLWANSDVQIDVLQNETQSYADSAQRLGAYADSLELTVQSLNEQVATVQTQLQDNQAKLDEITTQVDENQEQITMRRAALTVSLRTMYIDNQVTPLEIIASKGSLGAYLDKQAYQDIIRDRIATTMSALKKLQKKLQTQQKEQKRIVQENTAIAENLKQRQAEQQELLADTRSQQKEYAALVESKNADVANLRARQLAANGSAFGGGKVIPGDPSKGDYPSDWDRAAQDSLVDKWGMYNRECVSYVAYKISTSHYMPYWGGRGNANEWPANAKSDGIPTGITPKVGAAAVSMNGPYGHVMYVEKVNDDGTIHVSQYNWALQGEYSEMTIRPNGLTYIYFQ